MRRAALLLAAIALASCGIRAGTARLFESRSQIDVREVARSLYCNTQGEGAQVQLLPDAQSVLDWQAARNVTLAGPESIAQTPYAIVEMGSRPTGGYGLAVARTASVRDEQVTLVTTFVSPAPGAMRTQAVSSPCVLVQLPRGRYAAVEVQDQAGEVRARGGLAAPAPAPPAS